jgi:hypothetical protein
LVVKAFLAGLCLLVLPVSAMAADRGSSSRLDEKTIGPESTEAQETHAELVAYSEWVIEVDASAAPALDAIRQLSPEWRAMLASRTPVEAAEKFTAFLDRADRVVAESKARVLALPLVSVARLDLGAEAQPAALRAEMTRMLDQVATVFVAMRPMAKAVATRNAKAMEAGAAPMLASVQALYRSQLAMTGAHVATLDEGDPARDSLMFDQLYFRSGLRILSTAKAMLSANSDPALAADLVELADEMDGVIDRGLANIDSSREEMLATLEELGNDAEGRAARAMLAKTIAMEALFRDSFGVARAYAAAMRSAGKGLTTATPTMVRLQPLLQQLRVTREQLDAVATRQIELMAESR